MYMCSIHINLWFSESCLCEFCSVMYISTFVGIHVCVYTRVHHENNNIGMPV